MEEGDQRMRDESVEDERSVGAEADPEAGLHDKEVTLASWPTRSASNVIEYFCGLAAVQ